MCFDSCLLSSTSAQYREYWRYSSCEIVLVVILRRHHRQYVSLGHSSKIDHFPPSSWDDHWTKNCHFFVGQLSTTFSARTDIFDKQHLFCVPDFFLAGRWHFGGIRIPRNSHSFFCYLGVPRFQSMNWQFLTKSRYFAFMNSFVGGRKLKFWQDWDTKKVKVLSTC